MKKCIFSTILIFAFASVFVACGSASTKKAEPTWIHGEVPQLCGVGGAAIGPNKIFSEQMAKNNARNEISKNIEIMVRGIFKTGESQFQDGDQINYESLAQEAARHVHSNALQFSQQIAGWEEEDNGKKYIRYLFCLPSGKVRDELEAQINGNANISEQIKNRMKNTMNELLKEADKQIEGIKESNSPVFIPEGHKN